MSDYAAVVHKLELLAQMFRQSKHDTWADVVQEASANIKFLADDSNRILAALRVLKQQNAKEFHFRAYEEFVKHICEQTLAGKGVN